MSKTNGRASRDGKAKTAVNPTHATVTVELMPKVSKLLREAVKLTGKSAGTLVFEALTERNELSRHLRGEISWAIHRKRSDAERRGKYQMPPHLAKTAAKDHPYNRRVLAAKLRSWAGQIVQMNRTLRRAEA